MSRIHYLLFLSLIICSFTKAKVTVYGKVTGPEDKPIRVAYVFLTLPSDNHAVKSIEVQKNGTYKISIDSKGLWMLHYTGVFHHEYKIPIYYKKSRRIKLDVRLSTYDYESKFNRAEIIGNFNDWQRYRPTKLKKNKNGIYSAVIDCKTDTVIYRMLNVRTGGEVAGTDADVYVPGGVDRKGLIGYNSILIAKNGKAKITFNPAKLIHYNRRGSFKIYPANSFIAKFAKAYTTYEDVKNLYEAELYAHLARFELSYKFHFGYYLGKIWNAMNKKQNSLTHQVLLLNYFELSYLSTHGNFVKVTTARKVLRGIPFSSAIWSLHPNAILRALNLAAYSGPLKDKYIHELLIYNPSAQTKAILLTDVIDWKFHSLDYSAIPPYLSILSDQYGDSPEAISYRKLYAKYIKLKDGVKAPEFSISSFRDTAIKFTNRTFLNKYLLIYFWSASNKASKDGFKDLYEAYERYGGEKFAVLTVSLDSSSNYVEKFFHRRAKMPWKNAIVEKGLKSKLCKSFEVYSLPKAVLIDTKGNVAAAGWDLRGKNLLNTLRKYMGE